MRKFTMMMFAALFVATAGMAQSGPKGAMTLRLKNQPAQTIAIERQQPRMADMQLQSTNQPGRSSRALAAQRGQADKLAMPWQRAAAVKHSPAKVVIADQPAGTRQLYSRSSDAKYPYWYWVFDTSVDGMVGDVVVNGDDFYLKNLFSQYLTQSWVKGTAKGSTVKFDFPQHVMSYDGTDYYACLLTYDAETDFYYTDESLTTLTLSYDARTGLVMTPADSPFSTGEVAVGLCDDEGYWTGYADWNINLTKVTEEPVAAPAGLETAEYSVVADGFEGTLAQVGFQGSDVYVQGLYSNMPEAWVKGSIVGDQVVFKGGQFMGADYVGGYLQYLVAASYTQEYDDYYDEYYDVYELTDGDIVFAYDPSARTLTDGSVFLVNAGTSTVNYAAAYRNAAIKPFTEVAATPAAPVFNEVYNGEWNYYLSGYGWGYLSFDLLPVDVDGNYILPEKLSYMIYTRVNGEERPLELSYYDYSNQVEPVMTEIPFGYSDSWDFYVRGTTREVYYYVIGAEAFGLQIIYRGAGEERRSEIAWMETEGLGSDLQPDVATPAYPDVDAAALGNSIAFGPYTGDENRSAYGDWTPQTIDVAMKLQDEFAEGCYIESITFPMKTRNVSDVKVWLSSQLRVENGRNAADIVEVSVASPRMGDNTVKLDKPYLVPAEGVYVGYSFTIDKEVNLAQGPVTVLTEVKPSGLYIHSSRCFLKWLDVAEALGYSASIEVALNGNKVQEHAVAPLDGDDVYARTGDPVDVSLTFENHGSAGVKSMTIEYSLNGMTQQSEVTLPTAVKGFYGKSFVHSVKLPAINKPGRYDLGVKVVKVNGEENTDPAPEAVVPVNVLNTLPKHRTLLEEYTGTWCGFCPRGFVALEWLAANYPDEFVCVSYHNGDPMEILDSDSFPSAVGGFPDAWMDRGMEVDPYYGSDPTYTQDLYIINDLMARNQMFGVAEMNVEATLSDDGGTVDVKADVTFAQDMDASPYQLEYILLADGLTGEGGSWPQSNYFSGDTSVGEPMSEFVNGEEYVEGLVFNDVAVLMSQVGGIEGSLPAEVVGDQTLSHAYAFNLDDALNTSFEPVIQDKTKLRVVALLVNTETGEVANACKADVNASGYTTGIAHFGQTDSHAVSSVQFFDLSGRQLPARAKGAAIVRITYADGSSRTVKVMK